MDKAASAHKDILRNHQECRVHTDMDCYLQLSFTYHCEETLYVETKSSFYFKFYWSSPLQRGDIRDIFNQTDLTVNIPKGEGLRQLTLW